MLCVSTVPFLALGSTLAPSTPTTITLLAVVSWPLRLRENFGSADRQSGTNRTRWGFGCRRGATVARVQVFGTHRCRQPFSGQTLRRRPPLLRRSSRGCLLFPCRRSSQSSLIQRLPAASPRRTA